MKRGKIGEKIAIGAFVCLLLAGCTTDVYEPLWNQSLNLFLRFRRILFLTSQWNRLMI